MTNDRELPLLNDDGKLLQFAPLIVLGFMYFPKDPERAIKFAAASIYEGLGEEIEEDREAFNALNRSGMLAQWFGLLTHSPVMADRLRQEALPSLSNGQIAASVLGVCLRLSNQFPRWASVNNAVAIVCRGMKKSRSEIMKAWGAFKPVAHLWWAAGAMSKWSEEALVGMVDEALAMNGQVPDSLDFDPHALASETCWEAFSVWSPANLPFLLTVAESVRLKAEKFKAKGATKPIFVPGTAYSAPKSLNIQPINVTLADLDDWMVAEIGGK